METRGNGIGRRRLAKVTIAPSVFPFVFRFVSFPAATYDHVIERKRWLAVVNFVKEWKVRSTGFDLIMNAFDLVCYYTILAFIYIYIIGYDTIYLCCLILWVKGVSDCVLRIEKFISQARASRAGTNDNYVIVVPLGSIVERRRNTYTVSSFIASCNKPIERRNVLA